MTHADVRIEEHLHALATVPVERRAEVGRKHTRVVPLPLPLPVVVEELDPAR